MPYIPEPTLFGTPPPGATSIQDLAYYSHFAGMLAATAGAVIAFARAPAKGLVSHVTMGAGLAAAAGAVFADKCLYANFIYGETARATAETGLFLMAGAAALLGAGVGLIPGFTHKRGEWPRFAIPALGAVGFALAGVGQLPALGSGAGLALGALGGVFVAAAGGLHLFDKAAAGKNAQEGVGASVGFALIISGLLTSVGAALARSEGGIDKGVAVIAFAEASFAIFSIFALLGVVGKAADFPKPVKKANVAAPVSPSAAVPAPGYVPPPPPGGAFPPPPPGGAPRAPQAPRPSSPGGAPRPPGA